MATHSHSIDAALAVIPSLPRPLLNRLVERAIERLDELDGDADFEDATDAEDEGFSHLAVRCALRAGPGCPIADPGGGNVEDAPHDDAGEAEPEHCLFPAYGDDQSKGPSGFGYEPKRRRSPVTVGKIAARGGVHKKAGCRHYSPIPGP